MAYIVVIPYTGTRINLTYPFRPDIFTCEIVSDLWLFFVAPLIHGSSISSDMRFIFGACDVRIFHPLKEEEKTEAGIKHNNSYTNTYVYVRASINDFMSQN